MVSMISRRSLLVGVSTLALCCDAEAFMRGGSAIIPSFTAQWQPMLLGDGGNAISPRIYPSGTLLTNVDSYNAYLYMGSTPTTVGGRTLPTPAWKPMFRSDNITGRTPLQTLAGTPQVGAIAEHPGNTNIFMAIMDGRIWISQDRGSNWAATSQTITFGVNAGPVQSQWIAGDPNDATGATWYVNTPSQGVFKTTNATSGGSATFSAVGAIAAASSNRGGSIVFDTTTSGGSQKIWISSYGTGIYESTNNGSSWSLLNSAGMPTVTTILTSDKFGQVWSGEGQAGGFTIKFYTGGAWTSRTVSNFNSNFYPVALLFDPNTGASVSGNRIIAVLGFGDLSVSLDNGATWAGCLNGTITSTGNQCAWLGTAKQSSAGITSLNLNGATIDASGTVWVAGGISLWTTTNPIVAGVVQSTANWAANSIGIEMLVVASVIEVPGGPVFTSAWDRAVLRNLNPDDFADVQFPQNKSVLEDNFNIDFSFKSGSTTAVDRIVAQVSGSTSSSYSDDGGATWTNWPTQPSNIGAGGLIAVSTTSCWACVPGNGTPGYSQIYITTDGGTTWTLATGFSGTPRFVPNNDRASGTGQITIVADKAAGAGVFYAVDCAGPAIYKCTNGTSASPSFTRVDTGSPFSGVNFNGKVKLVMIPGNAGHMMLCGYPGNSAFVWRSTNGGVSWAIPSAMSTFDQVPGIAVGAPKPGGSGYPTIYVLTNIGDTANHKIYYSIDGFGTFNLLNVPTAQQSYPLGSLDYPTFIAGSPNVYGRVYYSWTGYGCAYIDMADAVPWVGFSNRKPNEALSGTQTVTARHSGLVPVTSVQFKLDGSNIGSAQTGQTSYSINFNFSGVAPGAHILTAVATGANGDGSFSIPINTS